jgi:hypothetical protein
MWETAKRALLIAWGSALLLGSWAFFLYPAAATLRAVLSAEILAAAQPPSLRRDFEATAARYASWARGYLSSRRAAALDPGDVARTEWPMFGSVFFLLSAEEMAKRDAPLSEQARDALRLAADVVADPATATWVQEKWGASYLERDNVFYRMLLLLGLGSYEAQTGDRRHAAILRAQTESLTRELLAAPLHLADDYPGECYPNDVLWAVVALRRATALGYGSRDDVERLARELFTVLDGPARAEQGLPAFQVDAASGTPLQPARGSGNSGILSMAAELDQGIASRWYARYAEQYWSEGWLHGFRELPRGMKSHGDVDSGPILFGVGSVASGFGIGAARSVGRLDHAVPLAMEAVAASWPTPFGPLIPDALGWIAADGWCFGKLALLFSFTRPTLATSSVAYEGNVPTLVWLCIAFFLAGATRTGWKGAAAISAACRRWTAVRPD